MSVQDFFDKMIEIIDECEAAIETFDCEDCGIESRTDARTFLTEKLYEIRSERRDAKAYMRKELKRSQRPEKNLKE